MERYWVPELSSIETSNQSFSPSTDTTDSVSTEWYILLVQEEESADTASLSETAELIDTIFSIDTCDGVYDEDEETDDEDDDEGLTDEELEEAADSAASALTDFLDTEEVCSDDALVYVRVYRSDMTVPYELELSDGEIVNSEILTEDIEEAVTVSGTSSITLSAPVTGDLSLVPTTTVISESGDTPTVTGISGASISLSEEVTTIYTASYSTVYERLTIKLPIDDDDEVEDIVISAFYLGLVDTLETSYSTDASDSDVSDICAILSSAVEVVDDTPDEPEGCYQVREYKRLCRCSGSTDTSDTVIEAIDCPEGHDAGDTIYLTPDYSVDTYVSCPSEEGTGDISDPDYYLETCCEGYGGTLPICEEIRSGYFGGEEIEGGKQAYIDLYGANTQFIALSPEDGKCGENIVKQNVVAKSCCDEVLELVYDSANSVSVLADNSSGIVAVLDGKLPLTVSVRGSGFFLTAAGAKDGTVTGRNFRIYTQDACGSCTVTISDGCSTVSGSLKAVDGIWAGDCRIYSVADYGAGNAGATTDCFEVLDTCIPQRSTLQTYYGTCPAPYCMRYANWGVWQWGGYGWTKVWGDSGGLKYVVVADCNGNPVLGQGGVALAAAIAAAPLEYGADPNEVFPNGPDDVGCSCGSVEWVC
jgi:hypothetical protein